MVCKGESRWLKGKRVKIVIRGGAQMIIVKEVRRQTGWRLSDGCAWEEREVERDGAQWSGYRRGKGKMEIDW